MNSYKDFKKITNYTTHIKNHKWSFNFSINRITASPNLDNYVYDNTYISKNVEDFNKYSECFEALIIEINNLIFCKTCNRFDNPFCKICKLDDIIDTITQNDNNDECPICYKVLSNRYITICNTPKHMICSTCYEKIDKFNNNKCPICRGTNQTQQLQQNLDESQDDNEVNVY